MSDRSADSWRRTASMSVAPANPFVVDRDGSCGEVIAKYRVWIVEQPALMATLHELPCEMLIKLANG